ncbi:class A beta-lactamase-related serine hydrolase [Marinilabiliaceae bacterium JC017]|nr:class A beta-lactamase-related serine hydrolase [Marinilabiliaceae bacterium JC017]
MKLIIKLVFTLIIVAIGWISEAYFISSHGLFGNDFNPPLNHPTSFHINSLFSDVENFMPLDKQIQRFINRENMAGASVALAYNGRLVYAKGFGYADVENKISIEPYNLFRVASISKLVTATGIMKLVEDGYLTLNQKVFGEHGILNDPKYLHYIDPRIENITVINLLNHSGGWTTRWGDPMFMPTVIARKLHKALPVSEDDIIEFVLSKRLHFKPGGMSYYSNFGFMVLGKVIEKTSGMPYEAYIQTHVLYPLGIFDMQIGGSYLEERNSSEVKYYEPEETFFVEDYRGSGQQVLRAYGGNDIKTLGACGGWLASSTDLLKMMLAIDGNKNTPDILKESLINKMVTPVEIGMSPLGWRRINRQGWFRTGTLSGSSALMVSKPNGISYVVLCNSGSWKGPKLSNDIFRAMEKGLKGIKEWPEYDLFSLDNNKKKTKCRQEIIF